MQKTVVWWGSSNSTRFENKYSWQKDGIKWMVGLSRNNQLRVIEVKCNSYCRYLRSADAECTRNFMKSVLHSSIGKTSYFHATIRDHIQLGWLKKIILILHGIFYHTLTLLPRSCLDRLPPFLFLTKLFKWKKSQNLKSDSAMLLIFFHSKPASFYKEVIDKLCRAMGCR